jgi:hypothetical protein
LTAQIIAKKVQLAMTLDGDARAALQKSINKLAEQKVLYQKRARRSGLRLKKRIMPKLQK